jgi:hypothetical protein
VLVLDVVLALDFGCPMPARGILAYCFLSAWIPVRPGSKIENDNEFEED